MITKNSIKMCEANEEIQKEWKNETGDFVYWKVTKSIKVLTNHFYTDDWGEFIWLPTQEQLQEMLFLKSNIFDGYDNVISIIYYFQLWLNEKFYGYYMRKPYPKGNILNELWLAFVMKEKYNKTWTGEKWVKAE